MKQGWEIKKLGEVCDIICGQDYKSVKDDNGKYPIYGTGGIMGYASQYRCPANSVIIGRKGSINNPLFVETEFWNVDTAFGVVPNEKILHPKFFYLFCKDYDFTRHDVSVTIPSLRRTDILKINVPVPPIAEQEKIVAELDCLSGIIEKKKQQLKELDNLAQSIFYEMFGDPVENDKGWEVKKFGDVANSELGKMLDSKKNQGELYPYLCSANVQWNDVDCTQVKEMRFEEDELERYRVYKGDLLICEGGDTGRCAIWKSDNAIYYQNALHRVRFVDGLMLPIFCLYTMKCYKERGEIDKYSSGQTIKHLVKKVLLTIPLIVPPITLQQEFASKIESIEKQKELIAQSIKETETLFNSRMDYYFN